jgi:hypothetical protein
VTHKGADKMESIGTLLKPTLTKKVNNQMLNSLTAGHSSPHENKINSEGADNDDELGNDEEPCSDNRDY